MIRLSLTCRRHGIRTSGAVCTVKVVCPLRRDLRSLGWTDYCALRFAEAIHVACGSLNLTRLWVIQ